MDNKFKKLKKEQELKPRLLSHEELISIVDSIKNGEGNNSMEEQLRAYTLERKRCRNQLER